MAASRIVRTSIVGTLVALSVLGPAASALACGGLVAPNGTINLLRTTTLAAYHRGVEHYVTSFQFAGKNAGEVGSIVPLPGVPTRVVKAGGWTLQRLELETQPPALELADAGTAAAAASPAQVLFKTQVDALDITVLKGGAVAVGTWATDHGFLLPPDAPEVLDFYARRSPIFLAARFNLERAEEQGVQTGEGTPIQIAIPTPNPWVPLRILSLGRQPNELIQADVFLLTDVPPSTLPQTVESDGDPGQRGLIQEVSEPASSSLMQDLRSDDRMGWLPTGGMWLTSINVNEEASRLTHDLAIDATGFGRPSPVAAGLVYPDAVDTPRAFPWAAAAIGGTVLAIVVAIAGGIAGRRRGRRGPRASTPGWDGRAA
jgi:Uncharacterized protein conserved in bacteria (DUF2330)